MTDINFYGGVDSPACTKRMAIPKPCPPVPPIIAIFILSSSILISLKKE